jgi:hypothetical protein
MTFHDNVSLVRIGILLYLVLEGRWYQVPTLELLIADTKSNPISQKYINRNIKHKENTNNLKRYEDIAIAEAISKTTIKKQFVASRTLMENGQMKCLIRATNSYCFLLSWGSEMNGSI